MFPPVAEPPCWSRSKQTLQAQQEFPAGGIFCPYCVAGVACAFHQFATPTAASRVRLNVHGCPKELRAPPGLEHPAQNVLSTSGEAISDSTVMHNAACTAASCVAFMEDCMLDAISETPDSEAASTDVGASDAWCEASDTSDPPSLPCPNSHNKIPCMGEELRAYGARYSAAAFPGRAGLPTRSGFQRRTQSNFMAQAR